MERLVTTCGHQGTSLAEQLDAIPLYPRVTPLVMLWPLPGEPGGMLRFERLEDWRAFVIALDIDGRIPFVVRAKFARALRLLYLTWLDGDLIKASELVALTTLELALRDRWPEPGKPPVFGHLLKAMVSNGLTDAQIPLVVRCGGGVIERILGTAHPSLSEIRNGLAHGDPFDGLPHAGLIELVRDLIDIAYKPYIADAPEQCAPERQHS